MIDEDDDGLPVLTQILRTGNASPGRHAAGVTTGLESGGGHDDDAQPMTDALIIGNEARGLPHADGIDAFALPQDHAHDRRSDDGAGFALDEPDIVGHGPTADTAPHRRASTPIATPAEPPLTLAFDVEPLDVGPAASNASAAPFQDPEATALRIRNAVLDDLMARVGPELDARIAQALHAEVETAIGQMQYNLRHQLGDALRDVVGRAVADEMRAHEARVDATAAP